MLSLVIDVYPLGSSEKQTSVKIPGGVLKVASNMIPKRVKDKLDLQGIDMDELMKLAENPESVGPVLEVEDHEKSERVVISLVS